MRQPEGTRGRGATVAAVVAVVAAVAWPAGPRGGPLPMIDVVTDSVRVQPAEERYDRLIQEAAAAHGVDPALVRAVVRAESRFDSRAVSPRGALGLMQLMPHVAAELGVTDPLDPRQNVFAGTRYLRRLLERHGGDVGLALASYNAGPRNVARYGGMPPFRETRGYVAKIRRDLARARTATLRPEDAAPAD